jgi:diaminohydroxyphosphoribosylaminopyrimidine deaminase/5-amino-6-(5-phosphoribosylamino)uracil reductase
LQLLVEGGSHVAAEFHRLCLVDRYVVYLAPAFVGGGDGLPMFSGDGATTMADVWRGRLVGVKRLGDDVRIDIEPAGTPPPNDCTQPPAGP